MSIVPPDSLQRLLAEEPFVRQLAHTLLADEADDVVQQTWLHAVRHGGGNADEPRSWLARVLFNVAHNFRRARQRRARHELAAAGAPPNVPGSAELLEREECRRQLVETIDQLPEQLRTVVLLRYFDGLPPRRIAAQLGLPVATVWNRLRQALQLLRERLDAQHDGQRRAWLLPLIPLAHMAPEASTPSLPVPASAHGNVVLTAKVKLAGAAAMLLACALALTIWRTADFGAAPRLVADDVAAAPRPAPSSQPDTALAEAALPRRLAPRAPSASAMAGTLVVHVRHADDRTAVAGITMLVMPVGGDLRVDALRRRTDQSGQVRFEGLPVARYHVVSDRCDIGKLVAIEDANTTDLDYDLPVGLTLTGIVVDRTGAPVANAALDLAPLGSIDIDAETVANTGADGRFVLRGAPVPVFFGARAAGHASSPLQFVQGRPGDTSELRLQLGGPAGTVSGTVVDAAGQVVPRAILRIGNGQTCGLGAVAGVPPVAATVHTDDEGKFVAVGIAAGSQPVVARAAGKAPWHGSCEVAANGTTSLRIELGNGATIRGKVSDAAGAAVSKATLVVGDLHDLARRSVRSSATGDYEITGLAAGHVQVVARHDTAGSAEQRVATTAGEVTLCDLRLSRGLELRGRIVDEAGAPVGKAILECFSPAAMPWLQRAHSDAEGRFVVPNCPPGAKLSITVRGNGIEQLTRHDVDPAAGPLELRVRRAAAATVKIRGTVIGPAGKPLANVSVRAVDRQGSRGPSPLTLTDADGRFELGPFAPGVWRVMVRSPLYPPFTSATRELAADAVWDLEQVHLVAGGTVRVSADGDLAAVRFVVIDAAGNVAGAFSNHGPTPLVSSPLTPGAYRLVVAAKTVTADATAFTVRAGEESNVSLQLRPGVRQLIELIAEALAPLPDHVTLRVLRGADLVTVATCSFRTSKRPTEELCLVPGEYRIAVFDGDRQLATSALTVATTESAPLQLELR